MTDWYNLSWSTVVNLMQSDAKKGLSYEGLLKSKQNYGDNKIVEIENTKFVKNIVKQFIEPWFAVICISIIALFYSHEIIAGVIILVILLANIYILVAQKYYKQKNFKALKKLNLGTCNVVRNGNLVSIDTKDVAVGDIVVYAKGSIIPADIRIMECEDLKVIETSITGDSNVIEKYSTKLLQNDLSLSEMGNILFKSSVVYSGSGEGIVLAIGMNTEIGKIMQCMLDIEKEDNGFYKGIHGILNIISILGLIGALCTYIIQKNNNLNNYVIANNLAGILLSVVPVSIVFVFCFIWLLLKRSFLKDSIHLNDLSVIQDISTVKTICTEKEGVLTGDTMFVKNIYDTEKIVDANEDFEFNDNISRIIEIGLLCNDSKGNDDKSSRSNIAEKALINFIRNIKLNKSAIDMKQKRLLKVPYDKERRIKTIVYRVSKKYRAYVKGAVDILLEECTHIMKNGVEKEITTEDINKIKSVDIEMSNDCLFVIGFAYRNFNYKPSKNENIESYLVFAGLVGFYNPIKIDMDLVINKCRLLAVKPIVITEDSKLTATALGKKLKIVNLGDIIITGAEMDNLGDGEFDRILEKISAFSRITSKQKVSIMNAYKSKENMVAFTGNKLLDLPSLRLAHLSIAFGKNCSNIIKKLSDVYFENIDFSKIIKLIANSKILINSYKEIIKYIFFSSLSQFVFCIFTVVLFKKFPFAISQIIWLNFGSVVLNSMLLFLNREKLEFNLHENYIIDKKIFVYNKEKIIFFSAVVAILALIEFQIINIYGNSSAETEAFVFYIFAPLIVLHSGGFIKGIKINAFTAITVIINLIMLCITYRMKIMYVEKINLFNVKITIGMLFAQMLIIFLSKLVNVFNDEEIIDV